MDETTVWFYCIMWKHHNIKPIFWSVWFVLAILTLVTSLSSTYLLIWTVLFFLVLIYASFDIRLGYFLKSYYRNKNEQSRRVAITFDDGPSEFTPEVLDLLRTYNAKATFFLIGKQIQKFPNLAKQLLAEGHSIGNHTMNHSNRFGFLNAEQVLQEINSCDAVIYETLLLKTRFFRPPFGVTNPSVAVAVKDSGDLMIGWSIRSLDTVLSHGESIYQRIIKKLKPGDVILLHDTSEKSIFALKKLLDYLAKEKYTCVTVDELLNLQAYEF
ncbi:polysaccharide deacetylase family protein [Sphingobacterium hungaricum]|nr:polysaccharide deacetylase family protein [Sphingobacterium hungaricum]